MKPSTNQASNSRRIWTLLCGIALAILAVFMTSCTDVCDTEITTYEYTPQFTSMTVIREQVEVTVPRTEIGSGKIYRYGTTLLVNEPNEGVHVVDNRDPANPVILSFITIPGNVDIALVGSTLYADSYIDLVVLDVSNIEDVQEVERFEGFFENLQWFGRGVGADQLVITGWDQTRTTRATQDCENITTNRWAWNESVLQFSNVDAGGAPSPSTGQGGSFARFAIAKNHLYTVDNWRLQVLDINAPASPKKVSENNLGWGIETIFPYKNNLFIGSNTGMQIFGIEDAATPVFKSEFTHARACDPVVANDKLAFVTLRSGNTCWTQNDRLEVLNIENLEKPQLIKAIDMINPHGLGIDGNKLFLCEGKGGLKSFTYSGTTAEDFELTQVEHLPNIDAYDVIPYQNVLMMIGDGGLYQFDYSEEKLKLLSKMDIASPAEFEF